MDYGISVIDLKVGIDVKLSEKMFGVDCSMNVQ